MKTGLFVRRSAAATLAVMICLITAACSGTYSTREQAGVSGGAEVYAISMDDALIIMETAMKKEFPEDSIEDVLTPHRGYRAKLRFVADIDIITVYAIPGQGRSEVGETIAGVAFEVHREGTYPVGGIPTSKAILAHVIEGASRLSKALPRM